MRAKKILKWSGGTLAVVLLLAGGLFAHLWYFRPLSIDIFFERVFLQFALEEPQLLSDIGILHQAGFRGLDDELSNVSPAHTEEITRIVRRDLEQLHGYDRASLFPAQQLSYDVLDWYLADEVEGRRWAYHTYPVNQLFGEQSETVDFMVRVHPLNDAEDARNYDERPLFKEAGTSGAYADSGSLDGSRPAAFFVNLRNMKEQPKFAMRSLTYHEGVPGHLLQGMFANTLVGVPTFRKVVPFTAYSEGWGLYAERLGWELGFESDPLDNLGRLQLEMLRAVRLVVDTGIHRKHWTREQAIDYMLEKTGNARSDATSEVERYFVLRGQALAYKVGMQKIMDLRAAAQKRLGPKFDIREFHSVVLTNGPLPLGTLEAQVNACAERRAR